MKKYFDNTENNFVAREMVIDQYEKYFDIFEIYVVTTAANLAHMKQILIQMKMQLARLKLSAGGLTFVLLKVRTHGQCLHGEKQGVIIFLAWSNLWLSSELSDWLL